MLGYLARRLIGSVPLVLGILTLIFFIMHLAPGDPTSRYFDPNVSPEVIEQMRHNLGLDQPVYIQYFKWIKAFLTGDFGMSFGQMRPISQILPPVMWNTLQLTLLSTVIIFVVGMLIGIFQAVRQYRTSDNVLTFGSKYRDVGSPGARCMMKKISVRIPRTRGTEPISRRAR